jgi:adenylate cyclase
MPIRWKIVAVVLPIITVTLSLSTLSSVLSATRAVSTVTEQLLRFKSGELEKHADAQWRLLVANGLAVEPTMVRAVQDAILLYAESLLEGDQDFVVAVDPRGTVVGTAGVSGAGPEDRAVLAELHRNRRDSMTDVVLGSTVWVAKGFYFAPFDHYYTLAVPRSDYYGEVDRIIREGLMILAVALLFSIVLMLLFSRRLTRPLSTVVTSMRRIIESHAMDERVPVEFRDETGELATTFNLMIADLDRAYSQIKRFAFDAVLARKRESKIRNIFQKYVPNDLIERFFQSPESMLVGENRELAILFSDIRSFTTISESMQPDELVKSLNRYFGRMVDVIVDHGGIVDKYIGDAIMAFFGAPVHHGDEPLQAVSAAVEMIEALDAFNADQHVQGAPRFQTGIGVSLGEVTVGNIGTERKMDYTVIGDPVNLASRLEGLTKKYGQPLIYSETLFPFVKSTYPWRLLDAVAVKGKSRGVRIYTSRKSIDDVTQRAWRIHNVAMEAYYRRDFAGALSGFSEVVALLPDDPVAAILVPRTQRLAKSPPGPEWNGVEVMTSK